jgi:hypothetical protein
LFPGVVSPDNCVLYLVTLTIKKFDDLNQYFELLRP